MWSASVVLINYLIHRFNPVLWLHPTEKYYPSSVADYVAHSQLWCNGTLEPRGVKLHDSILYNLSSPHGSDCFLKPNASVRSGFTHRLREAPVYVYYKQFRTFLEIRYIYFYGYNGAYNILHFLKYLDLNYGAHYADFEHVTLRFVRTGGDRKVALEKLYYSAHTTVEGMWRTPREVEWRERRPVAYVAFGSHGNYPSVGIWKRIFGFANDFCARGTLWKPERIVLVNNVSSDVSSEWRKYEGQYSSGNEVATLYSKTLGDAKPETERSTNSAERFFYLYPENM